MSHDVDEELPGVSHCQAQGLAGGGELGGNGNELPAWRGTGGGCGVVWRLRGEAGWPVDEARAVGERVGVGAAVADGATYAALAGGRH